MIILGRIKGDSIDPIFYGGLPWQPWISKNQSGFHAMSAKGFEHCSTIFA